MVKIAINTLACSKVKVGIGNYVTNLIHALAKIDHNNKYILFVGGQNKSIFQDLPSNFKLVEVNFWNRNRISRIFWEQFILPIKVRNLDILLSPGFVAPLLTNIKSLVTIHDMTFHTHPKVHQWSNKLYYKLLKPLSCKRVDHILAVSHSTKHDIVKVLKINPKKITVTHEAAHHRFKPSNKKKPYILYVGMLEPRKNVPALIRAFSKVPEPYKLIIVGKKGWKYGDIPREVKRLNLRNRIEFLGYVSDDHLVKLYNEATVFVYPSVYEGFGIPVLEAMQSGCPVITSDSSSLPEISGDAALLINPFNQQDLDKALISVLRNPHLRKRMSIMGINQAKKFTWRKTAEETLAVIDRCK